MKLETYYSFTNIREGDNNTFKWSADDDTTWTNLGVPTGCIMDEYVQIVISQFFRISTRCNVSYLLVKSVKLVLMCRIHSISPKRVFMVLVVRRVSNLLIS